MTTDRLRRSSAPETARQLVAELESRKVAIPDDVRTSLARLADLEGQKPPAPQGVDVQRAYIEGRLGDAQRLAAEIAVAPIASNAWREARLSLGLEVLATLHGNGDALTARLAKLAAPHIKGLTEAAAVGNIEPSTLLRDGRTADAELVARAEMHAHELGALYMLRKRLTADADYGAAHGLDCRTWRDPRPVLTAQAHGSAALSAVESFALGLRAGGELWFPLPSEAAAQARALKRADSAVAQAS